MDFTGKASRVWIDYETTEELRTRSEYPELEHSAVLWHAPRPPILHARVSTYVFDTDEGRKLGPHTITLGDVRYHFMIVEFEKEVATLRWHLSGPITKTDYLNAVEPVGKPVSRVRRMLDL